MQPTLAELGQCRTHIMPGTIHLSWLSQPFFGTTLQVSQVTSEEWSISPAKATSIPIACSHLLSAREISAKGDMHRYAMFIDVGMSSAAHHASSQNHGTARSTLTWEFLTIQVDGKVLVLSKLIRAAFKTTTALWLVYMETFKRFM